MKKLKVFTSALAVASLLLTSTPVYAQTYSNGQTSGSITVTASVESTYEISLPATINLTYDADAVENSRGYNYSATYTVGVKANLDVDSEEEVTVTPAATFTMTNGAVNATGNVSQTVNSWVSVIPSSANQIAANRLNFVETTGKLTVQLDEAGSYTGSLGFTFSKNHN